MANLLSARLIFIVGLLVISGVATPTTASSRSLEIARALSIAGCIVEHHSLPVTAVYDHKSDCIVVNSKLLASSDSQIAFILAHEHGHRAARHAEGIRDAAFAIHGLYKNPGSISRELTTVYHNYEYEADQLAVHRLLQHGWLDHYEITLLLKDSPETDSHPSGAARLKAIMEITNAD